jgi:hypothetical protein
MVEDKKGEWWVCAIPVTANEIRKDKLAAVDAVNSLLENFAHRRYIDPIRSVFGEALLPLYARLDSFHPNDMACRKLAAWLVENTIGNEAAN